jgi:tryptophan-rich sensory protein
MSRKDLWAAPLGEGFLILVVAVIGWVSHYPFLFASLGPTAYEQVETPSRPSAHPYNVIVGHVIAVAAGFAAVALMRAWNVGPVSAHGVPLPRVWAAVLACVFTVFITQLARASQPAALSTTLLVSLGLMQTWVEGGIIIAAVLLITCVGEPIRRMRLRQGH